MERISHLGSKDPSKEFYFIYHEDGSFNLVSAIGKQGGYIYFLVETKELFNNRSVKPKVSPISNILDYCGAPDTQVIAIDPKEPQNKTMCKQISDSIDEFSMLSSQRTAD